jgi:hypothetical protein
LAADCWLLATGCWLQALTLAAGCCALLLSAARPSHQHQIRIRIRI